MAGMWALGAESRRGAVVLVAVACAACLACTEDRYVTSPAGQRRPSLWAANVTANPANVLSAVVTARVQGAESISVWYHVKGAVGDVVTPAAVQPGDSVVLPVLGLEPMSRYVLRVVAFGGPEVVLSDSLEFGTDSLPGDLPRYTASGPEPTPGYVVFSAGKYGLVIDNSGRVVWYHRFLDGPGLTFMAQPNGRYVARPTTPDPSDLDLWVEVDPLGNITRTYGCARHLQPRFHDLIAQPDGGYWIMCDETRVMDLTTMGGVANARVTGTVVQHIGPEGDLVFEWNPFDHLSLLDLDSASRAAQAVNWTHGNSLDLDAGGNLLVSFRSLGEVTKIDTRSGAVLWRMGGLANQFAFQNTPIPAFSRQHSVRLAGSGELIMLDNMGDPQQSRAERYRLDESARTAWLAQGYGSTPAVVTAIGGGVQETAGGRTLVSFGTAGRVEEFDATGRLVWHVEGNAGYVFRAQRIASLYHPGVETPR